ncbi:hypothetical protein [Bordetella sp. LUAb4]|uniref:hypothetical protein n=1 Tax=Bordetella sp. LUAb4 TaxID=2843195 RepID=UPI001E59F425|nr:hypothetical protein [Bordetella sp. LUAb4]
MPINGPSAYATFPYFCSAAPDGVSTAPIDAPQRLTPRQIAAQCVEFYTEQPFSPRHGMAVSRLLAVCACDLQAASATEFDLDAVLTNILKRPPFHKSSTHVIQSLVNFLKSGLEPQAHDAASYAREHREKIAQILLENHHSAYRVDQFLAAARADVDESSELEIGVIRAAYEYSLNAAVLLAEPQHQDDVKAKADRYRTAARNLPSTVIAGSLTGLEASLSSAKTFDMPHKNYLRMWKNLQADLYAIQNAAPADLMLDMPPSVTCFIERYLQTLAGVRQRIESSTGNAGDLASWPIMSMNRAMLECLLPTARVTNALSAPMASLYRDGVPVSYEPMIDMAQCLYDQQQEISSFMGQLFASEIAETLPPKTWSGVSEIERAVGHWRTDDYSPAKWWPCTREPGAYAFSGILMELARRPTQRFSSLSSPVFETLSKLIDDPEIRKQAFAKAEEVLPIYRPAKAWILIRQCVDEHDIRNGSYDIPMKMGGYRLPGQRRIMDLVQEDFINIEKEEHGIEKGQEKLDDLEKNPESLEAFARYLWNTSTLFPTLVLRMYQYDFSDEEIDRSLQGLGMSQRLLNHSSPYIKRQIPYRRESPLVPTAHSAPYPFLPSAAISPAVDLSTPSTPRREEPLAQKRPAMGPPARPPAQRRPRRSQPASAGHRNA